MTGKVVDATLRFVDKFTEPMSKAVTKIEQSSKQIKRFGDNMAKTGRKITKTGNSLTKKVTTPVLAMGTASLKAGVDFEDAFTGVKKTVDATDKQLATLRQGILDMSKEIPASTDAIAGVAESAGQLGIETDNILGFTRVMVDLGNSTNISAEDAASSLAKFANVTGMSQTDFDKLGSTIVDLGNNFATTESDIVNMATRLSGAGSQIGLSNGDIMGISTALSSVGIEAEMGGSAFSKLMGSMKLATETNSKELDQFAKVAGMSGKEFSKAFKDDAGGAITSFIKGLGDSEKNGSSAIKVLDDMGIKEVRLRDTLLRASGASDVFADAIKTGNSAWEQNTALTEEATQKYENNKSKIEITKNKMKALAIQISDVLMPHFTKFVDGVGDLTTKFSDLDPKTQGAILKVAGFAAVTGPAVGAVGKMTEKTGKLISGVSKLPKNLSKAKKFLSNFRLENIKAKGAIVKQSASLAIYKTRLLAVKGKLAAQKVAQLGMAGATKISTLAQSALNATMFGFPVIWIVAGIAAVVAAGVLLYKNWDKVKEKAGELWEHIKKIFSPIGEWFAGIWEGVKTGFKGFINFIIGGLNRIPEGLNSLNVKIPDWVPGAGGKTLGFSVPTIPMLAKGTSNWRGGTAMVHDKGAEIIDLPRGSRVYPHSQSMKKAYQDGAKSNGNNVQIIINNTVTIRDEKDIDTFTHKMAEQLKKVVDNGGGEVKFA